MTFKIEHLLIIGLFFYIIFISTCGKKPIPEKEIIEVEVERIVEVHTRDTFKTKIFVPYANVPLTDIKPAKGFNFGDTSVFHTNTYIYSKKDSLIDYEIKIECECEPVDVKIKYDLTTLTVLDSFYIHDSTHTKEIIKKSFMSFGGQIIGNKNYFGFAPTITYSHKSGNNFGFGYDLINKNLHLTFTKKISLKK